MAGSADGVVRRILPVDSGRGDSRHHPQQPEVFCRQRPQDGKARQQVHSRRQYRGQRRRCGHRCRQRARHPRAAVGREILLRDRPQDQARGPAAEVRAHRVSRKARHAGGAHRADRATGRRDRAAGRRRCREDQARREAGEGRPAHGSGRRIPRGAGPDGEILRAGARRRCQRRAGDRGSLQAAGPERPRAGRSGRDCGSARRQDRHAGRLLGDRRKTDGIERPLCAAPGRFRHYSLYS